MADFGISSKNDFKYLINYIKETGHKIEGTTERNFISLVVVRKAIDEIVEYKAKEGLEKLLFNEENFDMYDNPKTWYNANDYSGIRSAFNSYEWEKNGEGYDGRRQHSFCFGEKLCMNGIQFFEDQKMLILTFRSCDAVNKLPFDLELINIMCEVYELDIERFYCIFGSLHIYDGD